MPHFSKRSTKSLETCHPKIIRVMHEVIQWENFSVIWGQRGESAQNRLAEDGRSQKHWPNSQHNRIPSYAIDVAPWPIDWTDNGRFMLLAGVIRYEARRQGIVLRWGGDWNQDGFTTDNKFNDLGHFELIE